MRCSFCGHEFDASEVTQTSCGACAGGCHGIHCPRCGYRNIQEPDFLKRLKQMVSRKKEDHKP